MSRLVRGSDGRFLGQLEPTGHVPSFLQEMIDNKLPFTAEKFLKKAE
jgi:pilus assembly protein CpaF